MFGKKSIYEKDPEGQHIQKININYAIEGLCDFF